MRSWIWYAVGGSLSVVLVGAFVLAAGDAATGTRPSQDPSDYVILADQLLRTKGSLTVESGAVGVVSGSLLTN